jgi:hypothetical protein
MARAHMEAGETVGVVAVDPTSPYSGGALLGDRIRMNELATDPRIFIRSMASRGSLGGLATTTTEVLDVMDAAGFPRLLVETVGVGQTELEIAGTADTVVVVLVPESGDGIQAMKAGLMEIADIFVVNKSDRPGADRLVREIRTALHYRAGDLGRTSVPAHHGVDLARGCAEGPGRRGCGQRRGCGRGRRGRSGRRGTRPRRRPQRRAHPSPGLPGYSRPSPMPARGCPSSSRPSRNTGPGWKPAENWSDGAWREPPPGSATCWIAS